MLIAHCISKNRTKSGSIADYTLQFTNGEINKFKVNEIKQGIISKQLVVDNLQIDKAGRLVDKTVSQVKKNSKISERDKIIQRITDNTPFKKAALLGKYICGKDIKCLYLIADDNRTRTITEEYAKELIKNNKSEFINIELSNNGEIIEKNVNISKHRDWLDINQGEMWGYIDKINKFNDEQKAFIKNYIIKNNYGMDEEDLISFFTNSETWFPSRFGNLDTACRDKGFDLMIKFKIINPYKCSFLTENYVKWLEENGKIPKEFKK